MVKKLTVILFCSLLFSGLKTYGQAPRIQWQKCYGGSDLDEAYSIQPTRDGGYIVTGRTHSRDGDVTSNHGFFGDYWVIKLTNMGALQWQKNLGGNGVDASYSVKETPDGGFVVAGSSTSTDGDVSFQHSTDRRSDCWIVKLSVAGSVQWQKSLGGSGSDTAVSIACTPDGGFIVGGSSDSNDFDVSGNHGGIDQWLVKLDATGHIQWQKSIGGSKWDMGGVTQPTSDGGYIIVGQSTSFNSRVGSTAIGFDYLVTKLNEKGVIEWQKSYGGSGDEYATSVQQTFDGGFIVCGYSESRDGDVRGNHGLYDYWIIKLNSAGSLEWQKCLGSSGNDHGMTVIETAADHGFVVAGISKTANGDVSNNHGNHDCWIVKLDVNGNIRWEKSYGGSGWDWPNSIVQTADGGFIVAGYTGSKDGDVTENHGSHDYWVFKLEPELCVPSIRITSTANKICEGTPVTFSSMVTNGGANPEFLWKKNGIKVGSNSPSYTAFDLADHDQITCTLTSNATCATVTTANSDTITMNVGVPFHSSLSITASATTICPGIPVTFQANVTNAGPNPAYQWKINDRDVGSNVSFYKSTHLSNGDQVYCLLAPDLNTCTDKTISSDTILISIKNAPAITIVPKDTIVPPGTGLQLTAAVQGTMRSYQWDAAETGTNFSSLSPVTAPLTNNTSYTLTVVNEEGCVASQKADIRIFKPVYMPNVFTPNGDGKNELYRIPKDVSLILKEFSIYDRWGNKVFSTNNSNEGWDGFIKGMKVNTGVYVYIVSGANESGNVLLKGSFLLMR